MRAATQQNVHLLSGQLMRLENEKSIRTTELLSCQAQRDAYYQHVRILQDIEREKAHQVLVVLYFVMIE
jgi:hypothetical protein